MRRDGIAFTAIRPLLRSGGRKVASAMVRLARLTQQANRLALRATVSDIATQSFSAYCESLRKLGIECEQQAGRSDSLQVRSFEADLRNAGSARLHTSIAYLNAQNPLDWTIGTMPERGEIDLDN